MAYEFIKVDREGPVTVITLNRPEVMNALHSPAHFEMDEALNAFAADPEQWVGIITGAGERAFSAGNDLKHQAGGGAMKSPPSGFAGLTSRFDLDKPLIAAVNGVAMGGGFEIALACDIIVASEGAVFALPEPRVGLAALAGGLHRLPRAIGVKRAMGMILTGRRVSAKEGYELGFVNEVVAPGELLAAARRWAATISELSPMSIRASKSAVLKGLDEPTLEAAITDQSRYPAVAALFKSEDFVEGPMAFAQKRPPQWKGR
ncbi:MAG TPA: enoyl-CoA hydratase-related protein [Caulobacteraceae bacterium]